MHVYHHVLIYYILYYTQKYRLRHEKPIKVESFSLNLDTLPYIGHTFIQKLFKVQARKMFELSTKMCCFIVHQNYYIHAYYNFTFGGQKRHYIPQKVSLSFLWKYITLFRIYINIRKKRICVTHYILYCTM